MNRKVADCRLVPSEKNCQLTISGPEEDVLQAAAEHARSAHGHTESIEELKEMIRPAMQDEK